VVQWEVEHVIDDYKTTESYWVYTPIQFLSNIKFKLPWSSKSAMEWKAILNSNLQAMFAKKGYKNNFV